MLSKITIDIKMFPAGFFLLEPINLKAGNMAHTNYMILGGPQP